MISMKGNEVIEQFIKKEIPFLYLYNNTRELFVIPKNGILFTINPLTNNEELICHRFDSITMDYDILDWFVERNPITILENFLESRNAS